MTSSGVWYRAAPAESRFYPNGGVPASLAVVARLGQNAFVQIEPGLRPLDRRRLPVGVWIICVTVVVAAWWLHLGHSTDDGFITFRYARNLALGHGLVFNPGEAWLGTTAPGWAMVLGLGGLMFGWPSIPWLAGLASAVCGAAVVAWIAVRLAPRGSRWPPP